MPIIFSINHESGYSISKFEGRISDEELLKAYEDFYMGEYWRPNQNELVDLSNADLTEITTEGMRCLSKFAESVFKAHNILSVKTALYAPKDLLFGLSRIYEVISNGSPENVKVFRDILEAKIWLKQNKRES
jgi:hypothetical protein